MSFLRNLLRARLDVVEARIDIPAPPSEVFAFLCDPVRMAKMSPGSQLDEVTDLPGGLHRTRLHRTRSDGVVVHVESEGIERVLDTRTVVRTRQWIEVAGRELRAEFLTTRTFARVAEGTLLTVSRERLNSPYVGNRSSRSRRYSQGLALHRSLERLRDAIAPEAAEPPVVTPETGNHPIASDRGGGLSHRAKVVGLAMLVATSAIVAIVLTEANSSTGNSPKAVASAYVNAILGEEPESACVLVSPAREKACIAYYTELRSSISLGGQANSERSVVRGDEAVVSVTFELCIASVGLCGRTPDSSRNLPSRSLPFDAAYSNSAKVSPLTTHTVACVRISGKWYVDLVVPGVKPRS